MKLLLLITFVILLEARSTPIQDKIRRILDFMQTVQGNGALAISTPTGLYPVNEIQENNIPSIFGFHDALRRELEEAKTEAKSKGKSFVSENFSADNAINLARRADKQQISSAPQSPQLRSNRPRGPPHRPPVHASGYNAANNAPSFGGVFNPPFDSESKIDANAQTEEEAVGFHAANKGEWTLAPSNVKVPEVAPEFGEDISIGL